MKRDLTVDATLISGFKNKTWKGRLYFVYYWFILVSIYFLIKLQFQKTQYSEVQWVAGRRDRLCGMLYNTRIVRGARILSIFLINSIITAKTFFIFSRMKVWFGLCFVRNTVFSILWNSEWEWNNLQWIKVQGDTVVYHWKGYNLSCKLFSISIIKNIFFIK